MTEEEWMAATEPDSMLTHLDERASERKRRLFAAACCLRVRDLLETDGDGIAETVSPHEVAQAASAVATACANIRGHSAGDPMHPMGMGDVLAAERGERLAQARLLRDLFGNPFRPVAFDPAWRSEAAIGIAQGIYEERAFERLPILADALQEAGCEDEAILTHCRRQGTHALGCWVLDLVLGKE